MFKYQLCLLFCFKLILTQSINKNNNGLLSISSENTEIITTVAEGVKIPDVELSENVNKERQTARNAYPYVVPRKGVSSKTVIARKGVNITAFSLTNKTTDDIISIEPTTQIILNDISLKQNHFTAPNKTNNMTNTTYKNSNNGKKKYKPKPTATNAGIDTNAKKVNYHPMPTRTPPLGMPTKMTYVVPVIVTILILPFFILLMIYVYKHSRDCWNKRHYRRMDFLIDGMYNE